MKEHGEFDSGRLNSHKVRARDLEPMQVTEEDGGRLNAFAKEPRMEVMDAQSSRSNSSRLFIVGGGVLVVTLMALTMMIS